MIDIIRHTFEHGDELSDDDRNVLNIYGQLAYVDEPISDNNLFDLRNEFLSEQSRCYVLIHDDNLSGVANYHNQPDLNESYLHTMVIDQEKRGLGLGKYMVNFLMERTKKDGNKLLSLAAVRDAVGFYTDLGFVMTVDDPKLPEMIKRV
jgi:GNAT superfamily N-acetyltransferase